MPDGSDDWTSGSEWGDEPTNEKNENETTKPKTPETVKPRNELKINDRLSQNTPEKSPVLNQKLENFKNAISSQENRRRSNPVGVQRRKSTRNTRETTKRLETMSIKKPESKQKHSTPYSKTSSSRESRQPPVNDGRHCGKVTYQPTYSHENDDKIYQKTCNAGIDFDKYDEVHVQVNFVGKNKVSPISSFDDFGTNPSLRENLAKAGWHKPTPIQKYSIPIILNKLDLLGCAQTGSGKTAAFTIPIIQALLENGVRGTENSEFNPTISPEVLVTAPTRELVIQIDREFCKLTRNTGLKTQFVIGGHAAQHQRSKFQKGCNILVATPGRLKDWIQRGAILLDRIQYVVLDEADRMLHMGFKSNLEYFYRVMQASKEVKNRQTMMFSATFPQDIQKLAKFFLNDKYAFVAVGIVGGASSLVKQEIVKLDGKEKLRKLIESVEESFKHKQKNGEPKRVLIFVDTKRFADYLGARFSETDMPTTTLHGDRRQEQREEALANFRSGKHPVLIATNVAARGLDIPDVHQVINFELPSDIGEYVHRIGRTGRCGNHGKAISFYESSRDKRIARDILRIFQDSNQEVPGWLVEEANGVEKAVDSEKANGSESSNEGKNANEGQKSNKGETNKSERLELQVVKSESELKSKESTILKNGENAVNLELGKKLANQNHKNESSSDSDW